MKRTAPFTIITKTGREFTEADMERLVSEADLGSDALDLGAGEFLREYKGGFEVGIDGPLVAVWLDDDLDARLVAMADVSGSSAAALMRLALGNYVERPPELRQPQPEADLSGWQWLLHLDAHLAEKVEAFAASERCHLNVVVNRAVRQLLDTQ